MRYDAPQDRKGLDVLIQRIFDAHKYEKVRKFPRIPIRLRATDTALGEALQYVVRDVSRGRPRHRDGAAGDAQVDQDGDSVLADAVAVDRPARAARRGRVAVSASSWIGGC